jgi:hypothetical protein
MLGDTQLKLEPTIAWYTNQFVTNDDEQRGSMYQTYVGNKKT